MHAADSCPARVDYWTTICVLGGGLLSPVQLGIDAL
jgi:hypothetical protein